MENSVATPAADVGFEQVDAAQFDNSAETVDVGTLMQEDTTPTVAPAEPVATIQQPQDDAASGKGFRSQEDFDRVLGRRLGDERRRYESSPEYMLGQQLIRERAARDGITAQEAYQRIQNDHVQQKAEQYAKDPKAFYADYLTQQNRPYTPTPQPASQPADAAAYCRRRNGHGLSAAAHHAAVRSGCAAVRRTDGTSPVAERQRPHAGCRSSAA